MYSIAGNYRGAKHSRLSNINLVTLWIIFLWLHAIAVLNPRSQQSVELHASPNLLKYCDMIVDKLNVIVRGLNCMAT